MIDLRLSLAEAKALQKRTSNKGQVTSEEVAMLRRTGLRLAALIGNAEREGGAT